MNAAPGTSLDEDGFLAWWFTPWRQAAVASPTSIPEDILAERDRYRLWCAEAGLPAQLPPGADAGWRAVVTADGTALHATARLFGGLVAARHHDRAVLQALDAGARQWCASVAATQPLALCTQGGAAPCFTSTATDLAAVHGLAQLACRLALEYPGLWPRLRRCLAPGLAADADALATTLVAAPLSAPARARLLRCWQLSRQAAAGPSFPPPAAAPAP